MKNIIWKKANGGIAFTTFADGAEVDSNAHADELKTGGHVPEDYVPVAYDVELQADAYFRDGWVWENGVTHDLQRCREIHRDRMRKAREPKLALLDIEQLRGRNVEAAKQALRDVTADLRIDAAVSVEELKLIWPEILK